MLLDPYWPYFFYILIILLVGGFNHFLFSIIYGNNHPNWLIFSEGLEPPTSLCHSNVDYIDPFRCCWYSLVPAHFEQHRLWRFLLFSTSCDGLLDGACCAIICRSWQARMRRRREHQYNHYQEEEDNLRKLKEAWAIGSYWFLARWEVLRLHKWSIGYESQNGLGKSKLPSGKLT